jgi:hypothetical protein
VQGFGVQIGKSAWSMRGLAGLPPLFQADQPAAYWEYLADAVLVAFVLSLFLALRVGWSLIALSRSYRGLTRAPDE